MKENDMEFKDNKQNEVIKKDNKKARGPFLIIIIISAIGGGILGVMTQILVKSFSDISKTFHVFMKENAMTIEITVTIVMVVIMTVIVVWSVMTIIRGKKNAVIFIEADDEKSLEKLENKLSYSIWLTSALLILDYLFFSVVIFVDKKYVSGGGISLLIIMLIVFVAVMTAATVLQQKIVDLTRLINPEKKGSIYDLRFHKKWEESCDEAELLMTYKAAYMAYRAVNMLCIALWVLFVIIGMTTGTGFLAVVVVLVIWAVLTSVYCYYSMKLSA